MLARRRLYFATLMLSLVIPGAVAPEATSNDRTDVPDSCPVTRPSFPAFIPPAPYPQNPPGRTFWHGTQGLWTMLSPDGVFRGITSASTLAPGEISTGNKQFWWRPGFYPTGTAEPPLKITARRLDAAAPALPQPWVTNAHHETFGGWTMLIGLELPTLGCWEVTGAYGADEITFVVWVNPASLQRHPPAAR